MLFAFSDYNDSETNESIEEVKVNQLGRTLIEDKFDTDEYRILVVANKFQTGFNQPLLSAMFLDKAIKGINAVQTVSRLNRKHVDKEQDDIYNEQDGIFSIMSKTVIETIRFSKAA